MYKLIKDPRTNQVVAVSIVGTTKSFLLDQDNSDFQTFVKELADDFTILQDADGKQADQGTIKAILKGKN